ncbi:ArnT family glycosyltransferase [Rhodopirellula sp. JC639]|uniref:ArnT family glycosyltransferase n=1 Tax=Stieleria mannarensis TaxID=2755585 RepID=UPI0016006005|nr:glycosyltransferase family 39 protein [Rhodopirellula sp. JC639]
MSLPRKLAFTLLVFLLIAKVVSVVMRGPSPLVLDAAGYWELGGLVAEGDWLMMQRPIAFRTPAYPWLIGLFRAVFDNPLPVLVSFQGLLWVAGIGLVAALAVEISQRRQAAGLVVAMAIPMLASVVYVATMLTETLFVFSLVLHLWAVARLTRRPSLWAGVFVGLTLGLAILTRPVAMLVWIADLIYVITCWHWIPNPSTGPIGRRRGWISVALAGIVTVGCVSPWLARNHALFGKAMLTEFVGRNVWIVTFQDGSGAGLDLPATAAAVQLKTQLGDQGWERLAADERWRETWTVSKALTTSGMDDPSADRLMKAVATDAIAASPLAFGKKTVRRWINFWRTRATELPDQIADLDPDGTGARERLSSDLFAGQPIWGVTVAPVATGLRHRWSNSLAGNTLLMLATLASTMLLIWRRPTRAAGLWLGAILGYFATITAVLEIPAYRYRMIVEPIVLLVIALAIVSISTCDGGLRVWWGSGVKKFVGQKTGENEEEI